MKVLIFGIMLILLSIETFANEDSTDGYWQFSSYYGIHRFKDYLNNDNFDDALYNLGFENRNVYNLMQTIAFGFDFVQPHTLAFFGNKYSLLFEKSENLEICKSLNISYSESFYNISLLGGTIISFNESFYLDFTFGLSYLIYQANITNDSLGLSKDINEVINGGSNNHVLNSSYLGFIGRAGLMYNVYDILLSNDKKYDVWLGYSIDLYLSHNNILSGKIYVNDSNQEISKLKFIIDRTVVQRFCISFTF